MKHASSTRWDRIPRSRPCRKPTRGGLNAMSVVGPIVENNSCLGLLLGFCLVFLNRRQCAMKWIWRDSHRPCHGGRVYAFVWLSCADWFNHGLYNRGRYHRMGILWCAERSRLLDWLSIYFYLDLAGAVLLAVRDWLLHILKRVESPLRS